MAYVAAIVNAPLLFDNMNIEMCWFNPVSSAVDFWQHNENSSNG